MMVAKNNNNLFIYLFIFLLGNFKNLQPPLLVFLRKREKKKERMNE